MATLLKAFEDARPLLNDNNTTPKIWTNAKLLPFVPKAHRELQLILWNNQIPTIKEVSTNITVSINATTITIPTDLIEIISIGERASGSNGEFTPMREVEYENLTVVRSATLMYYAWREEEIKVFGATVARQVQLNYLKGLTIPTAITDPIGFMFGEMYLGPRIASLAAGSVGNSSALIELTADANQWKDMIISANVKAGQNRPVQRIPYRRSRGSR